MSTPPPGREARIGRGTAVFVLTVGMFVALRLWRLTTYSLRPDEIFSLETARQAWGGLILRATRDLVHPPLFYALLKAWIAIGGQSELWLRLLPVSMAVVSASLTTGLRKRNVPTRTFSALGC